MREQAPASQLSYEKFRHLLWCGGRKSTHSLLLLSVLRQLPVPTDVQCQWRRPSEWKIERGGKHSLYIQVKDENEEEKAALVLRFNLLSSIPFANSTTILLLTFLPHAPFFLTLFYLLVIVREDDDDDDDSMCLQIKHIRNNNSNEPNLSLSLSVSVSFVLVYANSPTSISTTYSAWIEIQPIILGEL